MGIGLIPVGSNWVKDRRFVVFFGEEMRREIEDQIRARVLARNPGADVAAVTGSVKVRHTGSGQFSVSFVNLLGDIALPATTTPVRPIPLKEAIGKVDVPWEDPVQAGVRAALKKVPTVLMRVKRAIAGGQIGPPKAVLPLRLALRR